MKQCIALFGHNHTFSLPVMHKDFKHHGVFLFTACPFGQQEERI
jgi:hypothetical protein